MTRRNITGPRANMAVPRPAFVTWEARRRYADLLHAMVAHADDPFIRTGYSEAEVREIVADAGLTIGEYNEQVSRLRERDSETLGGNQW